jgi:predicted Zn-dependent peptidase
LLLHFAARSYAAAMGRARGLVVVAFVALLGGGARDAGAELPFREPLATTFVLPNGLTVVLTEDHRAPLIGAELRYRVGSRDDPPARPGMAGLLPRLMTRATQHLGDGEYDRRLDAAGCFDSRWVATLDRTFFGVTAPAEQLGLVLWMWSDQMGFFAGRVDAPRIDAQVAVHGNERLQRIDNVPAGRVPEMVTSALYPPGHPYHPGLMRSPAGLAGLTVAEVRAFAQAHYTPDHAILALTGDFSSRKATELVRRYFGSLPSGRPLPRPPGAVPALATEMRLQVAARVDAASVTLAWPTPPAFAPGDAELDLVAELLVGHRAGWLRWRLVDELKIASDVSARQESRALGSVFVIHATATRGHAAAELTSAIDEVLATLQGTTPDTHSMESALAGFLVDHLFELEKSAARAHLLAGCAERNAVGSCYEAMFAPYARVAPEALGRVAAEQLPLRRRVGAEVTPAPDAPLAGELRGAAGGIE